jgi:hypothetical protein
MVQKMSATSFYRRSTAGLRFANEANTMALSSFPPHEQSCFLLRRIAVELVKHPGLSGKPVCLVAVIVSKPE